LLFSTTSQPIIFKTISEQKYPTSEIIFLISEGIPSHLCLGETDDRQRQKAFFSFSIISLNIKVTVN
jgi:hypothetical protein